MNKPFAVLEEWVREGRVRLSPIHAGEEVREAPAEELPSDLPDDQLFVYAMKDVKSLGWSSVPLHAREPMNIEGQDEEQDALRALEEFVRRGNIEIEHTAEYIEGSVHPHGKFYLDDLRSGRFSVQAHMDLHGFDLNDARIVMEDFVLRSIREGYACIRIVHGRGRHSFKHHSVLKENIQKWLCTRRMSRHVIAYTSARRCDGGGGAVYVLLRR